MWLREGGENWWYILGEIQDKGRVTNHLAAEQKEGNEKKGGCRWNGDQTGKIACAWECVDGSDWIGVVKGGVEGDG